MSSNCMDRNEQSRDTRNKRNHIAVHSQHHISFSNSKHICQILILVLTIYTIVFNKKYKNNRLPAEHTKCEQFNNLLS